MHELIRRIDLRAAQDHQHELLRREWLLTNGLGGYAAGTISGTVTRRYHGLLIAALPAPLGRVVMFNHLAESVRMPDGRVVQFGGEEPSHQEEVSLELRPSLHFRAHELDVGESLQGTYILSIHGPRYEVCCSDLPALR